ncbi:MAG: hypothetical protein LQ338_005716, partial [Usnochroma carphineum]
MSTATSRGHTAEGFSVTGHSRLQIGDIHNYGSTTEEEHECLRSLWPTGIDYESQKNQNPKRVAETCLWTLKNSKYIEWRDDDAKKLLWISADPGCGKSVLARCIIDEDLPQAFRNNPSKHVLYYFFRDTSPEQRSVARAISTILHQLFVSQTQLIQHALPSYREIGRALSDTFPKLWSIFVAAATDPLAGDVICVLDALDECDEHEGETLVEALESLCVHQQTLFSTSRLKFLVTSRPYYYIRRSFDELRRVFHNIELAGSDESAKIKEEIDVVIRHRVAKLGQENRLAKKVTDHLEKRLLETENRTYLWLRLLWEIVRKSLSGTITEMNKLIDNLPAGIQDSYEILLRRCPEPSFARRVLQIVSVAYRPLTLDEIDVALSVNEQTSSYTDLDLEGCSRLQETLPTRCGLMISVVQSKVYFIHQTVKEFLLDKDGMGSPAGRMWQRSLRLEESHDVMAKICLRSITLSEIQWDQANLGNALIPERLRHMEPNEYCRGCSLLPYTAVYWAEHYRNTKDEDMGTIARILETSSSRPIIAQYDRNYGTLLHLASAEGHERILQILLKKGADVNAQSGHYGTALQAASCEGYGEIVNVLLKKGADVNAQSGHYGTALQAASCEGYSEIVNVLLKKGADTNVQGGLYGTALQAASYQGRDTIVHTLLKKGADVNAQSGRYGTALQAASCEGYDEIVNVLLKKGADTNVQGGLYGTALQAASYQGRDTIVHTLLKKGADVNAQGGLYRTALQAASKKGRNTIVHTLLKKGADINAQGGRFRTALLAALIKGHDTIVHMLLKEGADANAQGGYLGPALHTASFEGRDEAVQQLLEYHAAVELKDIQGRVPIHLACARGHKKIIELLFSLGPDWTMIDTQGRNCLHHAASGGSTEVVRWLLEEGLDPNTADRDGWTPLHWAARRGSVDTMRALKAASAISTIEAIEGWTPDQVAVFHHQKLSSVSEAGASNEDAKSEPVLQPTPVLGIRELSVMGAF